MDFRRLVEDGKYRKEDLKPEDRAFVEGMEFVMRDILNVELAMIKDDYEVSDPANTTPLYSKLMCEIESDAIMQLKKSIYVAICEAIVEILDSYLGEEDQEEEAPEVEEAQKE